MRKLVFLISVLSFVACVMNLAGCSKNGPLAPATAPSQGKMMFAMEAADNIASGNVTITKGADQHVLPITIVNHTGTVAFDGIQVGHWTIQANLFDADRNEIYSGSGDALVTKNQTTTAQIRVQQNTGNLQIIVQVPGLVLWNKLGSDIEVQNSQAGPNGQVVGTLGYLPGQFGNGLSSPIFTSDEYTNYSRYDNLTLNQQGCVEFWYQPTWNDPSVGHVVTLMGFGPADANTKFNVSYNDWQNRFAINFYDDTSNNYVCKYIVPSQVPGWSTSQPFHVAIVWDGTAANNVDKVRMFINGQEIATQVNVMGGNPTFSNWGAQSLSVGALIGSSLQYDHNHQGCTGVMDNIKIWDYPKTDFSDRFNE